MYFKNPNESPYNFVSNNPVNYYDVMGLDKNAVSPFLKKLRAGAAARWAGWGADYGSAPAVGGGGGGGGGGAGGGGYNFTESDIRSIIEAAFYFGDILYYDDYSVTLNYNCSILSVRGHNEPIDHVYEDEPDVIKSYAEFKWIPDAYSIERSDLGIIGNQIRERAGSDFSKDMFENYWLGKGDYTLRNFRFKDIVNAANNLPIEETLNVTFNGRQSIAKIINFYSNSKYSPAFGRATVYYDLNGKAIGFKDFYNFDSKSWGTRSYSAEIKTRSVNFWGNVFGAKPFYINYP